MKMYGLEGESKCENIALFKLTYCVLSRNVVLYWSLYFPVHKKRGRKHLLLFFKVQFLFFASLLTQSLRNNRCCTLMVQ